MLEKPDVKDLTLISALQTEYGLRTAELAFLPLGADRNAAAYRAEAADGLSYFLKLRRGTFHEVSVALPAALTSLGVGRLIAPLETKDGHLWTRRDSFTLILYPFVEGQNGYNVALSERQWHDLGRTLREIHAVELPETLRSRIRTETYSLHWCHALRDFLILAGTIAPADDVVTDLMGFMQARSEAVLDLISRTERLAQSLQADSPAFVLCHSDIHPGNVLIDPSGALYVVDWDEPILAPKERDLMFIGGGWWGHRRSPQEEEALFYGGYGPADIDASAIAYYRRARIVEDIALFCEHILDPSTGARDREQSLKYLKSNFDPNGILQAAYASDQTR